jgi:putative transcriptional regulator
MSKMTGKTLGEEILEAVDEIQAFKYSMKAAPIQETKGSPVYTFTIDPKQRPDPYAPATIRKRFGLSQNQFAEVLGINVHTLQQWEQGKRKPTGPALRLLRLVADHPEVFDLCCE